MEGNPTKHEVTSLLEEVRLGGSVEAPPGAKEGSLQPRGVVSGDSDCAPARSKGDITGAVGSTIRGSVEVPRESLNSIVTEVSSVFHSQVDRVK